MSYLFVSSKQKENEDLNFCKIKVFNDKESEA